MAVEMMLWKLDTDNQNILSVFMSYFFGGWGGDRIRVYYYCPLRGVGHRKRLKSYIKRNTHLPKYTLKLDIILMSESAVRFF